ncbi:ribbon-helix-helix domain-containing protein [Leptolyngbya sp. AN03gr2]|uniref:ribbon-helix-helix domain-containing protein n=1 Tax=unclassified Leptolyngbya TaxID=2650499 RepID=UPI003D3116A4
MAGKKFGITLPNGTYSELDRLAKSRDDTAARLASFFVERAIAEARERGEIPPPDETVNEPDVSESESLAIVAEYIKLLTGERTERNGLSLAKLGKVLGINHHDLDALYKLVETCKQTDHDSRERKP